MNYYFKAIKNYANFKGRATRSEYWYYTLFAMIGAFIVAILDNLFGTTFSMDMAGTPVHLPYGYLYILYCLFLFLPGLAVCVRRLHDVGKSGWFFFISFIPLAGGIWILVLLCTDSQPHDNEYGPNPKAMPVDMGFQTDATITDTNVG